MLGDTFPAKVVGAFRTTGDGLPIHMNQTSLKSEFHFAVGN
jgi:hypothetical protein